MTDHDPQLDELVSAHLDGELSAEDAARVERDPDLRRRRDELAVARDALRAEVPRLDDAERDALLARVLAAVDRDAPDEPVTPDERVVAPVTPMGGRRRFDTSRVLAVAAAVLAIAFIGASLAMLGGTDSQSGDSAAGPPEAITMATEDADAGASVAEAAPGGGDAITDLGVAADEQGLRELLGAALDEYRAMSAATTQGPSGDGEGGGRSAESEDSGTSGHAPTDLGSTGAMSFLASCDPPEGAVVFRAILDDRAVVVHVRRAGDLDDVRVLDATTCGQVLQFTQ